MCPEPDHVLDLVAERLGSDLDLQEHVVQGALAGDVDHVLVPDLGDLQERVLDLRRENIDSADDKHVVGPSGDPADPGGCPSALALVLHQGGDVLDPVADHGHGLLLEHGDDHLSLLSGSEGLSGLGVDDLDVHDVPCDVDSFALLALGEHGSGLLGGSVDVVGLDAHGLLDVLPHALGPGLGSENRLPELGVPADVDTHLLGDVSEVDEVRGSACDRRDAQVHHELDLPLGASGSRGQDGCSDLLGTVVESESSREESVSIGDLHGVITTDTYGGQGPSEGLGPVCEVVLGVSDEGGLTGGPG